MSINGGDTSSFDNTHRAFLQTFNTRGSLTFEEAQPILAAYMSTHEDRAVLPNDITRTDFDQYVNTINIAISSSDYEIRGAMPQTYEKSNNSATQESRSRVWALVNTTSDPATQLATKHKPEEIVFVKRVLDKMFDQYNSPTYEIMACTTMQALEVSKPSGGRQSDVNGNVDGAASIGLTKTQAETILNSLQDEGWLVKVGNYLTLSPRALLELRDWLRETYNEPAEEEDDEPVERIKSCAACREIVTIGQRCSRKECRTRLHEHCMGSYFRMQGNRQTCALCKDNWTGDAFVGPKAARSRTSTGGAARRQDGSEEETPVPARKRQRQSGGMSAAARGKQRASNGTSARRRTSEVAEDDAGVAENHDEAEDDEEEDEEEDRTQTASGQTNGTAHHPSQRHDRSQSDDPPRPTQVYDVSSSEGDD